jgi:hypothetical protein
MLIKICQPFSVTKKIKKLIQYDKIQFFDYILVSQRRPPYKNEQEHLKPSSALTQTPCLPQRIFAKQKSSTISEIEYIHFIYI